MRHFFQKTSSACLFANFRSNSLSSKRIFVLAKPKTPPDHSNTCLNPTFSCVLKTPLLPDLCKPFLSACTLSTASQEQPGNGAPTEKLTPHERANAWRDRRSGRPLSLIMYDPFYRPARIFTPQIESANQVQQVVGVKDHFQPGFVRWETVTTRLIPTQGVLAFFYPVFNIPAPIVHFDHFTRCKL